MRQQALRWDARLRYAEPGACFRSRAKSCKPATATQVGSPCSDCAKSLAATISTGSVRFCWLGRQNSRRSAQETLYSGGNPEPGGPPGRRGGRTTRPRICMPSGARQKQVAPRGSRSVRRQGGGGRGAPGGGGMAQTGGGGRRGSAKASPATLAKATANQSLRIVFSSIAIQARCPRPH